MKTQARPLGAPRFAAIVSAAWAGVLLATEAFAQQPLNSISASARTQIETLIAEKAGRTPAQRKMDSQLIYFARQSRNQPISPALANHRADLKVAADRRVLVDITATISQGLLDTISVGGGEVINSFPAMRAARALVPIGLAESLAARNDVQFVMPAEEGTTNVGIPLSEAPRTHRADIARTTLGVDGTGIKIGVLSDGIDSLAVSKAAGNLNPNVSFVSGQNGSGDEGTAMMELIQDMLPGAQLVFATASTSSASFASNIISLRSAGCSIIVDDYTYFAESPFQDMNISQAVNTVSAAGVMYFSSARNSGNKNDGTAGTWEGDFADGGAASAPVTTAGNLHDFGGGTTYNTVASGGSQRRVDLFWADPLGASSNDYDLFILDSTGTSVLRSSTNFQSGTQNPYESSSTLNVGERIVIVKKPGAAARFLHLDTGRAVLSLSTPGCVRGHNASGAANAFSVAATNVANSPSPNFFTGGTTNPIETFSSDGPRRMFFDPSGTAYTAGNFSSTGGLVLNKPDITAADGARTSVNGFTTFFGTSAAAPHAAAIAAMIRNYKPSLTPAQVRTLMTSTALDIEAAGFDRDSGSGIVMALPALQATSAPDALTISQTGLDASGPTGGPFTPASGTYTLTNTGGSPVNWTAASTQSWNTVAPSSGTLAAGGSVVVTCAIDSTVASGLATGNRSDTITITNTVSGFTRQLSVNLVVKTAPAGNQTLTVLPNDGNFSAFGRAPITSSRFERTVYLITAAELAANGFATGSSPTAIGWNYQTAPGLAGAAPLAIYLQNTTDTTNTKSSTWSTAINGMTTVHSATTTLPNVTGTFDITFSGGSPFTYTGDGLYVAFDWGQYTGTLSTTAGVWCNTTLVNGLKGAQSTTSAPTTLTSSSYRPETRFTAAFTAAPSVTTPTSANITSNSATLGGNVTNAWGSSITGRGVVYARTSDNPNPRIGGANVTVVNDAATTTGVFAENVSGLADQTSYSFAAFATSVAGTTYTSPVSSFTTLSAAATVSSLNRANSSPTNAATVNWTLALSGAMAGVNASNFSLSGTAASGATIGTPVTGNGGLTWNVPVSTGALDGTLMLSLANATGLSPSVSTPLPFDGQAYTMQKSAPTISGAVAGQAVTDKTTVLPFSAVTLADADLPAITQAVSVTLDVATKGSFTTLNGFTNAGGGSYTFSGTAAAATTAIRGLVFTPSANRVAPGSVETTTLTISISDGIRPAATDNTTSIVSTSINDAPTIAGAVFGQAVTDKTTISPFTGVTLADVDSPAQTQSVSVTLDTAAKGSFTTLNGFTNAGGGSYTFSGTAAQATTAIRGLVFTPTANRVAPGSTETTAFVISINDGIASAVTNNATTVVSTSINDAPTATDLSAVETYTEDTSLNLVDIVVNDVDSATVTATLTLSNPSAGSLTTGTSGAVTSSFSAGVWTASGTIANVNTLLAGVTFNPATNFNAAFTINTSVSDGVASPITGSKTMTGVPVNDAPTATNLVAAETYTEDTPLDLTDIVATDVDSSTITATLTLSNPAAGSLTTGTSGVVTSTFAAGVWTASGAIANVNALLASVTFSPTANFNASFSITTSVSDGVATAITGSKAVTGIAVNDAPTATNLSAAETYTEDAVLNLIDIVASDIDSTSVTVTLILSDSGAGTVSTGTSGAVTSTFASGVWSASGAIADVDALLAGVTFTPAADFNSAFTISASVSDGVAAAVTGVKAMTGIPVNDPPTATNLATTETYTEDTALNLADIVVTDVDNPTVSVSLTLSNSGAGSLTTGTSGAVTSTFAAGVWAASGTVADVNALLSGVSFQPTANFNGGFTIATSVSDGIAAAVTGIKTVTGLAVNDSPTSSAPLAMSTAEDNGLAFNGADLLHVADVDGSDLEVTLAATHGTLSLSTTSGLSFATGNGNANAAMKFSGSQTNLNAALATLTFNPTPDFNGEAGVAFTTSDSEAQPVVKTVTIAVSAVADIVADAVVTDEDTVLVFNPIAGTQGASADNFEGTPVLTSVTQGIHGSVTFDAGGAVTYDPSLDFNGSDSFTYTVTSGGVTETAAVTVTVNAVNDPPTATNLSAAETYLEDRPLHLIPITATDVDSASVTATLILSDPLAGIVNTATVGAVTSTFSAATGTWTASGAIASVNQLLANLTFTPAADFSGNFTITTSISDGVAPAVTGSKTMTGLAVNDPPTIANIAGPLTMLEDASLQTLNLSGISTGAGEAQTITISAVSDNPALIPNPTVSYTSANATGSLSFAPVSQASGTATVTVAVRDNGGVANGGLDETVRTFVVNVTAVNDSPAFTKGANVTVLEDAGPQTIANWATGISAGPPDEASQLLDFIVVADQPALFQTQPAIAANGTLTFAWKANQSGSATVTVSLHDDGGTANGGVDTSAAQTFTISTTAVNDAPSFVAGSGIDTAQDAGPQTFPGWATAISAGPNEGSQAVHFVVQVDKPALFTAGPAITPTGTLSYTPAPNGSGVATMTVSLQDDGGTGNGGINTSPALTVEIAVTSFIEELGSYTGIVQPATSGPRENARTGSVTWKVATGGKFTGRISLPGKSAAFRGAIGQDGVAHFGKTLTPTFTINRKGLSSLELALQAEVARGTNTFRGTLRDGANDFAVLEGDRALYTAKRNPVPPLAAVPDSLLGNYTALLPALTPAAQSLSAQAFPQGTGFARITVGKTGVAKLTGTLADGAKFSSAAPLAKSGRWPIYRTFGKKGSVGGFATFRVVPDVSDVDSANLLWFNTGNARSPRYATGWPGGILVGLTGARYTAPSRSAPGPVLPGLGIADANGNAALTFTAGGIVNPGVLLALAIDANNRPSLLSSTSPRSIFALSAKTGLLKGKFAHPASGKAVPFNGAVLQKQKRGAGFFLGPTESGTVSLVPDDSPGAP